MASDSMIRMRARSRSVDGVAVLVPNTPLRNPDEAIENSSPRANGSMDDLQLIGQELVIQRTIRGQWTPARTQVGRTPPQSVHSNLAEPTSAQQVVVSASCELVDANGLLHHREGEGMTGSVGRRESQLMSMPRGSPVSYMVQHLAGIIYPHCFDLEQLRRFQDLQGQAPWLYGQPNDTPVPRPRYLPDNPLTTRWKMG